MKDRGSIVENWVRKSEDRIEAAENELQSGRLEIAVSHLYYSMFYMVTAILMAMDSPPLTKHSAVKAAFHRNVVKQGLVSSEYGKLYQKLFDYRHKADYSPITEFEPEEVRDQLENLKLFFLEAKRLISQ